MRSKLLKGGLLGLLALTLSVPAMVSGKDGEEVPAALQFKMKSIDGKDIALSKYKGKVVLIVNVASACGLTKQYLQLQAIHKRFSQQGLAIIGFPCNQFGNQEPGTNLEIKEFCTSKYNVTFDMFAKIKVNGEDACDLYKHLKSVAPQPKGEGEVSWNFEKFVLNRKGEVIGRYKPATKPGDPVLMKQIKDALADK